jgi:hypothetical protein
MQRHSTPLTWRPLGTSDTLDAGNTFSGAMATLKDMIPDPTTRGLWQCRPAAIQMTSFPGFGSPGLVSLLYIVGDLAYGLIATTAHAGRDEPFCYNLITNTFIAVTGATGVNTPVSPSATGAWTPPTADLIGSKLVVTHPGFSGGGGVYFGWFDIINPAAPTWNGGNLTGAIAFTTPPSAVRQFNQRAYFITNVVAQPAVVFSDVLNAINVTSGTQVLTFGDTVPLTALGALPLQNQLGGIIQGLMVFKGVKNIYQITGDAATSNLTVNSLNTATGTLAPLSVCQTPKGVAFMAPDGIRLIDQYAHVSDPIGIDGQGNTVPFIYSNVPSRVCAACNGTVLRVSTQNANVSGTPWQEWWYDIARERWHGPHSFPAAAIAAWNNTFVEAPQGVSGKLFRSDPVQSVTSTFVENGTQLTWQVGTPNLPDTDQMTTNFMSETTWDIALDPSTPAITVTAQHAQGDIVGTATIAPLGGSTIWGAFTWGSALWQGANNALAPRVLEWSDGIVFNRLAITAQGQSAQNVKVGTLRMRYQILRQLQNVMSVS